MNILITGGSSEIAQAIAERRHQLGDTLIITASTQESLEKTILLYKNKGVPVSGFVFNFTDPLASETTLRSLFAQPIDALILNACARVKTLKKLHALPFSEIQQYLRDNLEGNIWLLQTLLPHFIKNQFGRLVFISSLSALAGTSRYPIYCTTKAALEGLFLNLAVDYSAQNILSNIVRVGLIKTSRTEAFWKNPVYEKKISHIIPQQTMGESFQVAETLDPLLSKTSYITGSVITVSGGLPLMRSEGLLS